MRERKIKQTNCTGCSTPLVKPQLKFCSYECRYKYNIRSGRGVAYQQERKAKSIESYIAALLNKHTRKELKQQQEKVFALYHKQKGLCALSGVPMTYLCKQGIVPTNASIDRIDPNKGYTLDNIQFVCHMVNIMKWTMSVEGLLEWCTLILNNQPKD